SSCHSGRAGPSTWWPRSRSSTSCWSASGWASRSASASSCATDCKDEPMAELTVQELHLAYGDNPILKGVSMELNRGEVVSLLGPSGSGKTTLLRAVAGLEVPHKGSIRIGAREVLNGESGLDVPAEARNLGLVFQSYALWPH